MTRKAPGPKVSDKRKGIVLAKGGYKVRVLAQPVPITTTPTAPTPTVATASAQTPVVRSTATSIPVMVYKLATGQFAEVPHLTGKTQNDRNASVHSNPPPLKDMPNVPVGQGLLGPTQGQPLKTYLRQEKTGQFPLCQHLHLHLL